VNQKPLGKVHANLAQSFADVDLLDKLGDGPEAQQYGHVREAPNRGSIEEIDGKVSNVLAVDLWIVDSQVLQVSKRRSACPKTV
jgi:hypothetical protein